MQTYVPETDDSEIDATPASKLLPARAEQT